MLNASDILETIAMFDEENLDVRTITLGLSLFDCCDPDIDAACRKIYDKITRKAEKLVKTGEDIEKEYGIPIIHKRIAVTPISMIASSASEPRLCQIRTHARQSRPRRRRKLHRRIYGARSQRLRRRRRGTYRIDPRSARDDRLRLFVGKRRLD
jgi:hypothetical protein